MDGDGDIDSRPEYIGEHNGYRIWNCLTVTITPQDPTIQTGATQQFTANVSGTAPAVVWSITSGGGSISSTGLFTAPNTPQNVDIRAVPVSDPFVQGISFVVVINGQTWKTTSGRRDSPPNPQFQTFAYLGGRKPPRIAFTCCDSVYWETSPWSATGRNRGGSGPRNTPVSLPTHDAPQTGPRKRRTHRAVLAGCFL